MRSETSEACATEPSEEAESEAVSRKAPGLGPGVQIDEGRIQAHLDEVVRATVEETLDALLDAEADELCEARNHERTEGRKDTVASNYIRQLHTKVAEVTLCLNCALFRSRRRSLSATSGASPRSRKL